MLLFRARSEHDCSWWIVGGWGNHQHAVERTVAGAKAIVGPQTPGTIETNRWYDLRVELQDAHIRCYLDDKLIQTIEDRPPARFAVEAVSVAKTGEIILRAVNGENTPQPLTIDLAGLSATPLAGTATILTSAALADENTLDRPTAVSPKEQPFHAASPTFDYEFPPRSLTMLRLKAAK